MLAGLRTLQGALTATAEITPGGRMTGTGRRTNYAVDNPSQATRNVNNQAITD
ncbi:hypothetical protein RKD20_000057 [Streptomyces sp. SLBN-8D4]|jgi:hypothetical protein